MRSGGWLLCTATRRGRRRSTARWGSRAAADPLVPSRPSHWLCPAGGWGPIIPPGADWRLPPHSRRSAPVRSTYPGEWGRAAPVCEGARRPGFGPSRWSRGWPAGAAALGSPRVALPRSSAGAVVPSCARGGARLRGPAAPPSCCLPGGRCARRRSPWPSRRAAPLCPQPPTPPRPRARQVTPVAAQPPALPGAPPLSGGSERGGGAWQLRRASPSEGSGWLAEVPAADGGSRQRGVA